MQAHILIRIANTSVALTIHQALSRHNLQLMKGYKSTVKFLLFHTCIRSEVRCLSFIIRLVFLNCRVCQVQ